METQLFPQLGLICSYIRVPESAIVNYAWGYNKANKPIRVNPGVFDAEAYGVKSTAADMIRFVQANIEPSRLQAPHFAASAVWADPFNKTGSTSGFGVPDKKIGVVMLANRNFPIPARIKAAHAILEQFATLAK